MALASNSYGSTSDIGGLCPNWVDKTTRLFTTTTYPTLAQVERWVDQVSGAMNSVLREYGFVVPVTQADVVLMLGSFVNDEVATMVEGTHGLGRFGPEARGRSSSAPSRNALVLQDAQTFVKTNQAGMELMGATRDQATDGGVGFRSTDDNGATVDPWFQRADFGDRYHMGEES